MQEQHAMPRRFAGIRKKISLFLLTAVIGVAGVVLLVAYKQGALVRHTTIYFYAADVFGINKGMAVRLFGLPVGSVQDLTISDRGVRVELSIVSDYAKRVPKGSSARLTREGYIGAGNIQIVPGGDTPELQEPVRKGDVIGFIPNRGMAEIVEDIKGQLTPVMNEMRRMIADLNKPDSDFRKSVGSARTVLEELPETNRELRQVLRDTDRTLVSTAHASEQVAKALPALTTKLGSALDSLDEAAKEMKAVTHKNGEALHEVLLQAPALIRGGGELVRDGQEVVGAAKSTWLIRDYIETPAMRTLPVDSFESYGAGRDLRSTSAQR